MTPSIRGRFYFFGSDQVCKESTTRGFMKMTVPPFFIGVPSRLRPPMRFIREYIGGDRFGKILYRIEVLVNAAGGRRAAYLVPEELPGRVSVVQRLEKEATAGVSAHLL